MGKRIYFLSEEQIKDGVNLCFKKVHDILDDVEILCNNNGNEETAVSLYTIAIEEFGKGLLLKNSLKNKPERKGIPVSLDIFQGVEGHFLKIEEALRELPEECQIYQDVNLEIEDHKLPAKYKRFARDVPKMNEWQKEYQTKNPYVSFGPNMFALPFDFETRKNSLYVNWDPEHKRWNDDTTIDEYKIIETIDGHEKEIEKDQEKIYPEILIIAIDAFRDEIISNSLKKDKVV